MSDQEEGSLNQPRHLLGGQKGNSLLLRLHTAEYALDGGSTALILSILEAQLSPVLRRVLCPGAQAMEPRVHTREPTLREDTFKGQLAIIHGEILNQEGVYKL